MPSNIVVGLVFLFGAVFGATVSAFVVGLLSARSKDRQTAEYQAAWFIAEAARACLIIPSTNWPMQKVFGELRTTLVKLTPVEEHNRRIRNRKRGKSGAGL